MTIDEAVANLQQRRKYSVAIDTVLAELARLREVESDSLLLHGAGWQESLKAVHGWPHEAAHIQCTKLTGDILELQDELARLREANDALRAWAERVCEWFDDMLPRLLAARRCL